MYPTLRQSSPVVSVFARIRLVLIYLLLQLCTTAAVHADKKTDVELTNFAFANYLGTGFYATSDGVVFILSIPLSTTLRPMTSNDPGWVLNYPITVGVTNFDEISDGTVPDLNDVGTLSVIPGIEYHYPVMHNWTLIPFFDLGVARDVLNNRNIRILAAGVKSYATFDFDRNRLTLGNRLLFADESDFESSSDSNFAVFETGLDYNIPTDTIIHGSHIDVSLYYMNYYYLKELVLLKILDNPITLENKNEIGFTVSLPEHKWLPDNSRLGFGIQFTSNTEIYRLVFGAPFF